MENFRYADILNNVNPSWSIKEKSKFIYIKICEISSYDERFIYSKNPELLHNIYNREVNVDEYISPKLVCKTLNNIYSELLNRVGIKNKIISKPSSVNKAIEAQDVALIFYDENNTPYFTAIAADIQRCKYGMKTQFFGGCDNNYSEGKRDNVCIIKADEQMEIDKTIGYLKEHSVYADIVFDMIGLEIKQTNEFKKFLLESGIFIVRDYLKDCGETDPEKLSDKSIEKLIPLLSINDIIKIKMRLANIASKKHINTGPIESKKFSIHLLKNSILNKTEQRMYDVFDMIKEDGNTVEVLSILRFNLKPEPIYYLYSDELAQYVLLPIEDALVIMQNYHSKNDLDLVESR